MIAMFNWNVVLSYDVFRVMCLSMNPTDDTFLSGSLDKTIRLWDLRSQNCQVHFVVFFFLKSIIQCISLQGFTYFSYCISVF